jgi:hypothetical protein
VELVVTGFYGSGVSLVARHLIRAGLFIGDGLGNAPSRSDEDFCDPEVVTVHAGIMSDNGVDLTIDNFRPLYIHEERWSEMSRVIAQRQSHYSDWGFADPRSCFFLGAWKYLLPDARFIVVYRAPDDWLRCLESFNEVGDGVATWDVYNRHAAAFARANVEDCVVLSFERVSLGYPLIAKLNRRFGTDLAGIPPSEVSDRPESARPKASPEHGPDINERVADTWRSLEELARMTAVDP